MAEIASGSIDLKSLKVAGEPNKYVTMIDDNGIRVHEAGAVNTNFVQINSDGMQIYNGGDSFDKRIASFGIETVIGTSNSSQIYLDEDEIRGVGIDGKAFFNFDGKGRSDEINTSQSIYLDYLKGLISNPVNKTLETSFINANSTNITYTCQVTHKDSGNRNVVDLQENIEITYGTPSSQQYSVSDSIATYTITLTYDGLRSFGVSVSNNPSSSSSYYFRIWCLVWATNTTTAPKFQLGSGQAVGSFSLAEGCDTTAYGDYSHAEGKLTTAQGQGSHAEGVSTQANGDHSHAEGVYSYANGAGSHAEGASETYGASSHSEGNSTIASGDYSHAEGYHTGARGYCSHSSGIYTETAVQGGFVIGRYNQEDDGAYKLSTDTSIVSGKEYYTKSNYGFYSRVSSPSGDPSAKSYYELKSSWNDRTLKAFVIGNGVNGTNRSNALTVDWNGNIEAAGYTSHWCYVNAVTSITITAQRADTLIPITSIHSSSDSSVFECVNDGVQINISGTYMVSVSVSCSTATQNDLMGISVFKNGSASLGPTYTRMGGEFDRIHLLPTPIVINAGDVLTLYGRNNSGSRGTFDTCRFMIRKL